MKLQIKNQDWHIEKQVHVFLDLPVTLECGVFKYDSFPAPEGIFANILSNRLKNTLEQIILYHDPKNYYANQKLTIHYINLRSSSQTILIYCELYVHKIGGMYSTGESRDMMNLWLNKICEE